MIDWDKAACRGHNPEMWVRSAQTMQSKMDNETARSICRGNRERAPCPLLDECTEWAFGQLDTDRALIGTIAGWYESSNIRGYSMNVWMDEEYQGRWSIYTGRKENG